MRQLQAWLHRGHLFDLDYSDQILRMIIHTSYVQKNINVLLLLLVTVILRLLLDSLLASFFYLRNLYIDFWIQIVISTFLVTKSGWIYLIVQRFENEIHEVTRYIIENYSEDNYRIWKRNIIFLVCIYFLTYLSFVEITSQIIQLYIVQYMICYMTVEIIERKTLTCIPKFFSKKDKPYTYDDNCHITAPSSNKVEAHSIEPNISPVRPQESAATSDVCIEKNQQPLTNTDTTLHDIPNTDSTMHNVTNTDIALRNVSSGKIKYTPSESHLLSNNHAHFSLEDNVQLHQKTT